MRTHSLHTHTPGLGLANDLARVSASLTYMHGKVSKKATPLKRVNVLFIISVLTGKDCGWTSSHGVDQSESERPTRRVCVSCPSKEAFAMVAGEMCPRTNNQKTLVFKNHLDGGRPPTTPFEIKSRHVANDTCLHVVSSIGF